MCCCCCCWLLVFLTAARFWKKTSSRPRKGHPVHTFPSLICLAFLHNWATSLNKSQRWIHLEHYTIGKDEAWKKSSVPALVFVKLHSWIIQNMKPKATHSYQCAETLAKNPCSKSQTHAVECSSCCSNECYLATISVHFQELVAHFPRTSQPVFCAGVILHYLGSWRRYCCADATIARGDASASVYTRIHTVQCRTDAPVKDAKAKIAKGIISSQQVRQ